MEEVWKPIEYFEGSYEISNLGRVKSLPKWMGKYYSQQKILKPKLDKYGYERVNLCVPIEKGKRKTSLIHRLVAEAFIPNPDNKPQVNHVDGNKLNNKDFNLEWVTEKENTIHAWENGLKEIAREKASSTHGHSCYLINNVTGEKINFNSMNKLSLFLGYNGHWLASAIRNGNNYKEQCFKKGYNIVLEELNEKSKIDIL